jgi:hypothetical protein
MVKLLAAKRHYTRLSRVGKQTEAETEARVGALTPFDATAESRYFRTG